MEADQEEVAVLPVRISTVHALVYVVGIECFSARPQARVDGQVRRGEEEGRDPREVLLLFLLISDCPWSAFSPLAPRVGLILGLPCIRQQLAHPSVEVVRGHMCRFRMATHNETKDG